MWRLALASLHWNSFCIHLFDDSVINTFMYIWLTDIKSAAPYFRCIGVVLLNSRNSRCLLGIDRISLYIVCLSSSAALWKKKKKKRTATELQSLDLCLTLF